MEMTGAVSARKWGLSLRQRQRALPGANRIFARVYHDLEVDRSKSVAGKRVSDPGLQSHQRARPATDPKVLANRLITGNDGEGVYEFGLIKGVLDRSR